MAARDPAAPTPCVDVDAERRIIAVLIRDTRNAQRVPDLQPGDFASELYRRTMQAIRDVDDASPSEPVSPEAIEQVAMTTYGMRGPFLEDNLRPLAAAPDAVSEDLELYAAAVIELSISRRLIWACEHAALSLRHGQAFEDVVEQLEVSLADWDRLIHARKMADAADEKDHG